MRTILFAALFQLLSLSIFSQPMEADRPVIYTSTRQVADIAVAPDGSAWVATTGGVCRIAPDGTIRKFTRLDGLPSHEARHIAIANGNVVVTFPTAYAVWNGERWQTETSRVQNKSAEPSNAQHQTPNTQYPMCETLWHGNRYAATVEGLRVQEGATWRNIALPPSTGTHVSALMARSEGLLVALFGEGLWLWDGKNWKPFNISLPSEARDITALAEQGTALWIGTRRMGAWRYQNGRWQSFLNTNEPFDHDCQALTVYADKLFCSSLEDGLVVLEPETARNENASATDTKEMSAVRTGTATASTQPNGGWHYETTPALSFHAPRQMTVFQNRLYLRQTNGKVDRFDGTAWKRDVFADIPRREVTALASDEEHLYIAQWGGWSVWNGKQWTHHLDSPELQSLPLTCLLSDGETLWMGTQGKGILEVNTKTQTLRRHDERHGLPDDWITCLRRVGKTLYAGTFAGGLARWDGTTWRTYSPLEGANVTSLAEDAHGGLWIGTRTGLWYLAPDDTLRRVNDRLPWLDTEVQSLCGMENGLWIGTRTSLNFLPTDPTKYASSTHW